MNTTSIKLVIKVDEKDVEFVRKTFKSTGYSFIPSSIQSEFISAILNGTPLPKGHGRLIDESQIPGDGGWDFSDRLMSTPTIIEADRREDEAQSETEKGKVD